MKVGVNQKAASRYARPAAANERTKPNPGSPAAASNNSEQEMASAKAATQLLSGIAASRIAARTIPEKARLFAAFQSASRARGSKVRPVLCGPSPYFART